MEQMNPLFTEKISIYKSAFMRTKEVIVDRDEYFNNELSAEYVFFMQHLIRRCEKKLNMLDKMEDSSQGNMRGESSEEQKNLIIHYLSTRNFADFESANFDMELLAEVLNDLLNALPQPVIPFRYNDYCMYTDTCYEDALKLFYYVPRSNFKLFELIVKFLQMYAECLSSSDSTCHTVLANAVFQLEVRRVNANNGNVNSFAKIPSRFLETFIAKHKIFQTI